MCEKRLSRASAVLGSIDVGRESMLQSRIKGGEFASWALPAVFGNHVGGCLEQFLDRIARQSGEHCTGAVGKFVAQLYAPTQEPLENVGH